jgi:hypothetical protein
MLRAKRLITDPPVIEVTGHGHAHQH